MSKGVFVWKNTNNEKTKHRYLILPTNDMILIMKSTKASTLLEQEFDRYFIYTKRDDGTEISFFNFRIIQSEHGIILDQTHYIPQKVGKPYFTTPEKVPFQSCPFHLANTFEITLFSFLPLTHEEHLKYAKIFKENYNH